MVMLITKPSIATLSITLENIQTYIEVNIEFLIFFVNKALNVVFFLIIKAFGKMGL